MILLKTIQSDRIMIEQQVSHNLVSMMHKNNMVKKSVQVKSYVIYFYHNSDI